MTRKTKPLRSGFTTGAAAAAAAGGALDLLLAGTPPEAVSITFLTGDKTRIAINDCQLESADTAVCTVIKDAGDDPDVTHKAVIGARVTLKPATDHGGIEITGGIGVGVVTLPGLEIAPGQAAITAGPTAMIQNSVNEALAKHRSRAAVHVEVFVPEGERLAQKTLNARLGIIGGLSILGTTGIVRPMSHEAYVATIEKAMDVARAADQRHLVLTTGRRSERFAQARWPTVNDVAFVQIGDFFQVSLSAAARRDFERATLAIFFGKAVKMAQGTPHTHAAKSELTLRKLAKWTLALTGDTRLSKTVARSNTARHAFDPLKAAAPAVIERVARKAAAWARQFAEERVAVRCVIFDFDGSLVVDTTPEWG